MAARMPRLNPGGVRIGTAEIYRQVEKLDEVVEALVIGQTWPPGKLAGDIRIVLFVKLREGMQLDSALVEKIKNQVRVNTTPRHVPGQGAAGGPIFRVPRAARWSSWQYGTSCITTPVKNVDALANPEALELFRDPGRAADGIIGAANTGPPGPETSKY